jgi:TonB-linked SusC/RagA family outer membrane protein
MKLSAKLYNYLYNILYKFFLITRFCICLFFLGIMQLNAASYGQYVTLRQEENSIRQIFREIKSQTGFDVLYQSSKLNVDRKIKMIVHNQPIALVIKECIGDLGLRFVIQDNSIVIIDAIMMKERLSTQDSVIYKGRIIDENRNGMNGATVKITGSNRITNTTSRGDFAIYGPVKGTMEISYIGYLTKQITLNGLNPSNNLYIQMIPGNNNLGEVNIVSTGYQDISKERATGSFEVITKEQLQHSSDPNLIKRLEGITTSMDFNNNLTPINSASTTQASTSPRSSPLANLTIRGKNTLNPNQISFGNQSGQVLVVIDGVASPYPIDNVNPNDIESVTILKDAAAASIWGSRASNGVIVVKTKQGNYDKKINISFNSNFNITQKLNLFYKNVMSTSDYINAQVFQFNAADTRVDLPNIDIPQPFLSPVSEILGKQKNGVISREQANTELSLLGNIDIRRDFEKYILRPAFTQSYSLGLDGGSRKIAYRLSVGYDKSQENSVNAGSDRLSLAYNTSFRPIKKIEVSAGISYSLRKSENQASEQMVGAIATTPYYPYTKLADEQGMPLSIPYKYRPAFIDLLSTTYQGKIEDLSFTPLKNINEGYYNTNYKNINFNVSGNYKITDYLNANILYNYGLGDNQEVTLNRANSFYMRDLVTYFTNPSGVLSIPRGGLYRPSSNSIRGSSIRGQLNLNKSWSNHSLNAIAGTELTQGYSLSKSFQYFGYNETTLASNNQLNYKDPVPTLFDTGFGASSMIPYTSSTFSDSHIRTYSIYSNAAYTFKKRYTLSGSIRKDMSSEFGVGTNKGGSPFFSIGSKWNIASESFYHIDWLPFLQLRTTFGYNGNVNPQISGRPIIGYSGGVQINGLLFASPTNAGVSNRLLRPEKTGILNVGIDYGFKNGRISGSVEYYDKHTFDLLANNSLDPSTGYNRLSYNTANMHSWGADFTLNTQNVMSGKFSWSSTLLASYNRVKVTKLFTAAAKSASDVVLGVPTYNENADLSRIYAYRWAGLDPLTGSPRGFANGQPIVVDNVSSYFNVTGQPLSTARYFGSAVPVYYGSLRNTLRYASLSLSVNFLYKLGYYFRRPQNDIVSYSALFNPSGLNVLQGAEYDKRWRNLGDENRTNVPSQLYPADQFRDLFYQFSEINVQKADHIRIQEVNLSYIINKKGWLLKSPRLYLNISNIGVIWRANKLGLDPDIADYPSPRTYAFGFSANF